MTKQPGVGTGLAVGGLAVLAVACCAAPALIAAGALTLIGAVLHSWWVIGIAAVVVLAALGYTLQRRSARGEPGQPQDCCPPPPPRPDTFADRLDPRSTP